MDRGVPRKLKEQLKNSPFKFTEKDWFGFFEKYHWKAGEIIFSFDEGNKINRPFPVFPFGVFLKFFPNSFLDSFRKKSGVALLDRKN
jgi:hypothetical protein